MPVTTIVETKAALYDAIKALSAEGGSLEGVGVFWGFPETRPDKEMVIVGDVSTNQQPAAIGTQRREENYTVQIHISVMASVLESQRVPTERAVVIAEAISDLIRPHGTFPLNVTNVYTMGVTKTDLSENVSPDTKEREAFMTLEISCMARI